MPVWPFGRIEKYLVIVELQIPENTAGYITAATNLWMAQLVEALRYKPEGRRIDYLWCHWNFSLT
jgi:hypothetical protein